MTTPSRATASATGSAGGYPAAGGFTTYGAKGRAPTFTPARQAGGGASASTTAPPRLSKQHETTVLSALLKARMLATTAHQAGLISRAEMDSAVKTFKAAEQALGLER